MPARSSVDASREVAAETRGHQVQLPHGPVQRGETRPPVGSGHGLGEEHDVLVAEQVQIGVQGLVVLEMDGAQPFPGAQVPRDRDRRPRSEWPVGDVGHHLQVQRRDPGDARVLDTGVSPCALPPGVRRQHHAEAFHPGRDAVGEQHPGQAHPRDVAGGHQSGQQVQPPVRVSAGGGVQHALDLVGVGQVRGHHHPDPAQGVPDGRVDRSRIGGHGVIPSRRSRDRWTRNVVGRSGRAPRRARRERPLRPGWSRTDSPSRPGPRRCSSPGRPRAVVWPAVW